MQKKDIIKNRTDKISIGLACIKLIRGQPPQILLIKKRYTYAFSNFVQGKYNTNFHLHENKEHIIKLFNRMTVAEKIDILSLDFDRIWRKIWGNAFNSHYYENAKNKFSRAFLIDGGVYLQKMVNKSTNAELIWEIPKGRKHNYSESDVACAIREFGEETNINKNAYKIYPQFKKNFQIADFGVNYISTYYLAITHNDINVAISFNANEQILECEDIRWMDLTTISCVTQDMDLVNFAKDIFRAAKKMQKRGEL